MNPSRIFTFSRAEFLAASRRDVAAVVECHQPPKVEALGGAQTAEVALGLQDGHAEKVSHRSESKSKARLVVGVTFNPARSRHPVKKVFEACLLVIRLVVIGVHSWKVVTAASRCNTPEANP